MNVTLPWVVAEAIRPHTEAPVEHYIPLRGSVEGSFGETHLVLTTHGSMLAVSKTSALGAMETLMLDGQVLPEWVSDRWGDALAVHDLGGKRYTVQLDSLGRDQALAALAHLYRCRMAWRHLARVLEKQIEASYDDDKRHALALELARLQRLEFGQRQQARDVYEQILLHRLSLIHI